jgi:hypothetical protein
VALEVLLTHARTGPNARITSAAPLSAVTGRCDHGHSQHKSPMIPCASFSYVQRKVSGAMWHLCNGELLVRVARKTLMSHGFMPEPMVATTASVS